ncbi:unknown [Anaerotruncus sp. CAG:528]|nr:unknown [Anaerotruncus sp. CAG:528]
MLFCSVIIEINCRDCCVKSVKSRSRIFYITVCSICKSCLKFRLSRVELLPISLIINKLTADIALAVAVCIRAIYDFINIAAFAVTMMCCTVFI